ncbi:MAG TPA: hypothetical protein VJ020_03905 [Anaerolineales bacterium]|nr:hypothetical protein [Anaerolineales bacterium]
MEGVFLTVKREHIVVGVSIAVLLGIGIATYWPLFSFTFFGEDPYDIGQVNNLTFSQLWLTPASNAYFRPLTLVLTKLLQSEAPFSPAPYYFFSIGARLSAALLLFGAAQHWFGSRPMAFSAALLFVLYSPGFEALARPSSLHSVLIPLSLAVLWLYSTGRETNRWLLIGASLFLAVISFLLHENSLVLPILVVMLELYLWQQRRVKQFGWPALLFLGPAFVFGVIWLSIPKPSLPIDTGLRPMSLLYISQGLSFPFARLIAQGGGWGLSAVWQTIVALVGSGVVLAVGISARRRPMLALTLGWWAVMSSPAWVALPFEYLQLSSRVFYFPAFAAGLAWASLMDERSGLKRMVGVVAVLLIAIQSWHALSQQIALYRAGSDLMKVIVAVGAEGKRPLFINVPDRFEYRRALYPVGYWGMLLAPVYNVWMSLFGCQPGCKYNPSHLGMTEK